ncbi:MAG: hypothetical protein ACOCQ2_01885 [Halanaerobiales bacterium]
MNKFTALLKIQIKEFIGKTLSGINIKNKSLARLIIYMLPLLLSIPVFHISILIFSVFLKTGNPELLITVVYIGAVILMFFLGIPLMVSEFFYTGDLEFLSSLPVTEDKIVFAKLSTIYIFLMIINLVLMGPALFIYGGYQGYSIIYILTSFLVLFGVPFLPLLISAIIIQIISGFLLKFNYKNLFYLITNLIMITSIIVLQLFANRYASNPENLNHVIKGGNSLLNSLGMMFPPGVWLTKMVMGSFWDAGMFLGLHIILFIILKMLSEKIYKKTIQSKQSKNIFSGQVYYKRRSAKYQLIKRHILIILKEPSFLLNTLLTLFVPVILFVMMSYTGQVSNDLLYSPDLRIYRNFILIAILCAPSLLGNLSATAITREGKAFWESRVLPVTDRVNISARVDTTIIINLLGTAFMSVFSIYLFDLKIKLLIIAIIFAISITLFFSVTDLIINIYRPFLNWNNPTAAVKNNINVLIALGFRVIIIFLGLLFYKFLAFYITSNIDLILIIFAVVFLAGYLLSRYVLYNKLIDRFRKISC